MSSETVSRRIAIATAAAHYALATLTGDPKIGRFLTRWPTSFLTESACADEKTGERMQFYYVPYYFPKLDVTLQVQVEMMVWDDKQIPPKIYSIQIADRDASPLSMLPLAIVFNFKGEHIETINIVAEPGSALVRTLKLLV